MLSYDCQIRVWYKHTDQMAICHHSNYICYYEAARSELLRYLGMSFAEVEKRGIMMPILEVQSKYHRPAYYDELLTVRIMLRELPTARINFFYEIYNEKGELLNTVMPIFLVSVPFDAITRVSTAAFYATEKNVLSYVLTFIEPIIMLVLMLMLPPVFGGQIMIWWSTVFAKVITASVSIVLSVRYSAQRNR